MQKGGSGKSFSHPEGRVTQCFGVVLTWVLEVLTILEGGSKGFKSLKGGRKKSNSVFMEGDVKVSDMRFSHFVAPPPRN